jgi:hypothetical protein
LFLSFSLCDPSKQSLRQLTQTPTQTNKRTQQFRFLCSNACPACNASPKLRHCRSRAWAILSLCLLVCFFIGLFVCLLGRCYVLNSAILCSSASLFVCLFVRLRPATADDGIAPDGIDAAPALPQPSTEQINKQRKKANKRTDN